MKKILEEKINKKQLTKTEIKIANFFLENSNSLFFLNAFEIGDELGVSNTSVIRFVKSLGFNSFKEFKSSLKNEVSSKILTPSEKLLLSESVLKRDDILDYFLEEITIGLRETLNKDSLKKIELIVNILKESEKKYIVSFKNSSGATAFFGLRLGFILPNVITHKENNSELIKNIVDIKKNDVLFLIIYPKYSKTYHLLIEYAKKAGAKIIIITDKVSSPFINSGDITLLAHTKGISFFNSMISTQALLEFILSFISKNLSNKEKNRLEMINNLLDENNK